MILYHHTVSSDLPRSQPPTTHGAVGNTYQPGWGDIISSVVFCLHSFSCLFIMICVSCRLFFCMLFLFVLLA